MTISAAIGFSALFWLFGTIILGLYSWYQTEKKARIDDKYFIAELRRTYGDEHVEECFPGGEHRPEPRLYRFLGRLGRGLSLGLGLPLQRPRK